jgi:hypothetical protein
MELTVGELRDAMHKVIPEVPSFAMRPETGGLSPLEKNSSAIREALIDAIETDGTKIERPTDRHAEIALAKLETYTIIGSCALEMHPYMVENHDGKSRFEPEVERLDGLLLPYDLRGSLKPMFLYGYDLFTNDNPWVGRTLEPRFAEAQEVFNQLRGARVAKTLRPLLDGGALGDTMQELLDLAERIEKQAPDYTPVTAESLDERLEKRYKLAEQLSYLALNKAGINIGALLPSANLSDLRGRMQTVTKNGTTVTSFRRESRSNMRSVFPPSLPDWERRPMDGPTLKCPFHQLDPKAIGDEVTEEVVPVIGEASSKDTALTELVEATLGFIHDRPERFLMSPAERSLHQFSQRPDTNAW